MGLRRNSSLQFSNIIFKAARERAETLAELSDLPTDVTSLVRHRADAKISGQLKRNDDTAVQSFGAEAYRYCTVVVVVIVVAMRFWVKGLNFSVNIVTYDFYACARVPGVPQPCSWRPALRHRCMLGGVPVVLKRLQQGCTQDLDQIDAHEQFVRRLLLLIGLQRYKYSILEVLHSMHLFLSTVISTFLLYRLQTAYYYRL